MRAGSAALLTRHCHGHVSDASCSDVTMATTSRKGSGMSRYITTLGACVTSAVPRALTTCNYTARDCYNVSIGFEMSVSDTPLDRAQVAPGVSTTSTPTYEMMGYSLTRRLPSTHSCARLTQGQGRCPRAPLTTGAQSASGSSFLLSCYPGWVECHLFSKKPEVTEDECACLLRDAATG